MNQNKWTAMTDFESDLQVVLGLLTGDLRSIDVDRLCVVTGCRRIRKQGAKVCGYHLAPDCVRARRGDDQMGVGMNVEEMNEKADELEASGSPVAAEFWRAAAQITLRLDKLIQLENS